MSRHFLHNILYFATQIIVDCKIAKVVPTDIIRERNRPHHKDKEIDELQIFQTAFLWCNFDSF